MSISSILVLSVTWATSSAYVMYYHNKQYTLGFDMVIGAILLGPILALIVRKDFEEKKKYYGVIEDNNSRMDETHRRWFQLNDRINRERMQSNWFRTIPPPPPISRVERAMAERDEAIRTAIERIDKNKLKDFKFFRG